MPSNATVASASIWVALGAAHFSMPLEPHGQVRTQQAIAPSATVVAGGTCEDAPLVPCGGDATIVFTGSFDTEPFACGPAREPVWFRFVAAEPAAVITTTQLAGPIPDTRVEAYAGTCGSLTPIGCSDDDGPASLSRLVLNDLSIGTTYYFRVGLGNSVGGTYEVQVTCVDGARPANDTCGSAIAIPPETIVLGNNTFAGDLAAQPQLPCSNEQAGSLWYRFVATSPLVSIESRRGVPDSGADNSILGAYARNPGSVGCEDLVLIGCANETGTPHNETMELYDLVVGEEYYIQLTSGPFARGIYSLEWVPADLTSGCEEAEPLVVGSSIALNNSQVEDGGGEPPFLCSPGGAVGALWYEFIATAEEIHISSDPVNPAGNAQDSRLDAFAGDCENPLPLACADSGIGGHELLELTGLTMGERYFLRFSTHPDERGAYNLRITDLTCANAEPLIAGQPVTVDTTVPGLASRAFSCTEVCHPATTMAPGFGARWYRFVATETGAILSTLGGAADGDSLLEVFSGSCSDRVSLACSDDLLPFCVAANNGLALSRIVMDNLVPGEEYSVLVASRGAVGTTPFVLSLESRPVVRPPNDRCEDRLVLTPGVPLVVDNTFATRDLDEPAPCAGHELTAPVWFEFAATSERMELTTALTSDAAFERGARRSYVHRYGSTCGPYFSGQCGLDRYLMTGLTVGETYIVMLDTYATTVGEYTVLVAAQPPNDEPEGAIELESLPAVLELWRDRIGATPFETASPFGGVGPTCGQDIWYRFEGTGTRIEADFLDTSNALCVDLFCSSDPLVPVTPTFIDGRRRWCTQVGLEYHLRVGTIGFDSVMALVDLGLTCTADPDCRPRGLCCLEDEASLLPEEDCEALDGRSSGPGNGFEALPVGLGFEVPPSEGGWVESAIFRDGVVCEEFCAEATSSGVGVVALETLEGDFFAVFATPAGHSFYSPPEEAALEFPNLVIPENAYELSFFLSIIDATLFVDSVPDYLEVRLDGALLDRFTLQDGSFLYREFRYDLAPYADGGFHTLTFEALSTSGYFDGGFIDKGWFLLDHVQMLLLGDDCESTPRVVAFDGFVNGHALAAGDVAGLSIVGTGFDNFGAAIFDSSPAGANAGEADPDLLVGRGGLLILQESQAQSSPGVFASPDDAQFGGSLHFVFDGPSEVWSIDLVDVDVGPPNQEVTLVLKDTVGRRRVYFVPEGFTEDLLAQGPPAVRTLDLRTLADQPGFAASALVLENEPGYDETRVRSLDVHLAGSGALDALTFVEGPLERGRL